MSIRRKLIFLIFLTIISFILFIVLYYFITSPISKIEKEKEILAEIKASFIKEQVELNKISTLRFEHQIEVFKNAVEQTKASFNKMESLKVLPKTNDAINDALKNIVDVQSLKDSWTVEFLYQVTFILADAKKIFFYTNTFTIPELLTDKKTSESEDFQKIANDVNDFFSSIQSLSDTLGSAVDTIDTQFTIIQKEVDKIRVRSNIIALIAVIIIIFISIFISILISNGIIRSISKVVGYVDKIASGDFTADVKIMTRDEISKLAENIKTMISNKLKVTIIDIKKSSETSMAVGGDLQESSNETLQAVDNINENASLINNKINELSDNITNVSAAIEQITKSIENVDDQIKDQSSAVEESGSAIEEMLASIANISSISQRKRENTDKLVETTKLGNQNINNMSLIIEKVSGKVDDILEMINVINEIADQTNLLSMNAAIEAANAGKYGTGFGVVADEIRRLAESAGENASEISAVLKSVIDSIKQASDASNETKSTFKLINKEIFEVANVLSEIIASTSELASGSNQILQSMNMLNEISLKVKEGSSFIRGGTEDINNSIQQSTLIFNDVLDGVAQILNMISDIKDLMGNVNSLSLKMNDISNSLDREVRKFKTQ